MNNINASAGHKLGQLIGDWFEEYFVLPLVTKVGQELSLFVDSRFTERIIDEENKAWFDTEGNSVDYDYVLELDATTSQRGIPVAFIECFWRRGSRHSKDKARDDSGKLLPMRESYPSARFLGIIAAGDFTMPARDLVRSRDIDLFYIPKEKIVNAFKNCKLTMDYDDKTSEDEKAEIARIFKNKLNFEKKSEVQKALFDLVGSAPISSYTDKVRASLSALPQEIRIILRYDSLPVIFESVEDVTQFLESPKFNMDSPKDSFLYQITYSDGSEFEKDIANIGDLRELHNQIVVLAKHMNLISQK